MKLTYRPEIDGLRAIAVVAVIAYHAQITIFGYQPFKGGFIGVDIFFVISGYLITSIILKELVATGSFSFKHFYERRIRRILPALLFVMLVSLPFAWVYLLPSSLIDFSKSILYSLGFTSNFYFHYSGQQYAAESALLEPFLHTWSLSVEEQYYILFPIVFLVTFKYLSKYLINILILGFVISLILAEWTSRNYPSISFYFIHTRMWELLLGSILAYFEITKGRKIKDKTLTTILPAIGLLLIGQSIIFFNDEMFHPSLYTLSPVIGVSLIIWFSNKKDLFITNILSNKLFVGIGLISYSLYLWHYPIFAFSRLTEFTDGNILKKLMLGVIILILSIFSYYFIEKPARKKYIKFKTLNVIIVLIFSIFIFYSFQVIKNYGYQDRLPEIIKKDSIEKPYFLLKNSEGENCHNNANGCRFNTDSNKKAFIIGDSHMASIMFDLKERLLNKNYQIITRTKGGCIYFPGFNLINKKTTKVHKNCDDIYFQSIKEELLLEKNSVIVLGGRFPLYLSNKFFDNLEGGRENGGKEWGNNYVANDNNINFKDSFKLELLEILKNNKVIIMYPIPETGWYPSRQIYLQWINKKNKLSREFDLKSVDTSFNVFKDRSKTSFELLDSIKSNNLYRVYPSKLFCNTKIKNRCITHDKSNFYYYDNDHPSIKGAEMINDLIMEQVEKIELKSN